jgi:hypothetical protein
MSETSGQSAHGLYDVVSRDATVSVRERGAPAA